jgi:hypothetical protein
MALTLKRQLDDAEKAQILKQHGRVCLILADYSLQTMGDPAMASRFNSI